MTMRSMRLGFLLLVLVFLACDKSNKTKDKKPMDAAMASVIAGYSSGTVSAEGPIRISLVNTASTDEPFAKSPFEFKPKIEGKTVWVDGHNLEFRPAQPLVRGQNYHAILHLDAVTAVPKNLKTFEFDFEAMNQYFERDIGSGLEVMDADHLEWQKTSGTLILADGEDATSIEKMLAASQADRSLTVHWEHKADRREHVFHIDSLKRGEAASALVLAWDGKSIGVDKSYNDTLTIPSINDFKVLSVEAEQEGDRCVTVRFSDPLRNGLDLRGLIDIVNQGGLRFQSTGNAVKIYSSNEWRGVKTVKVNAGVRNVFNKPLQNPATFSVSFEEVKPGVRFVGKGVIIPGSGNFSMPFEAVNLRSVTVSVTRIYAGNIPQFLQVNDLEGDNEMQRVGRMLLVKTVALNPTASTLQRWSRYALDLTELAQKKEEPGALYRISLSFTRQQSAFPCSDTGGVGAEAATLQNWDADNEAQASGWDGIDEYNSDGEYNWEDREDPCKPSYYKYNKTASRNFLPSNIGLMAKSGSPGKMTVIATDLLTAQPLVDADLEILNYQHQVLAKGKTDKDGFADLELTGKAFLLRASKGEQRGYLKLDDRAAMQMGQFDIGGMAVQQGLKGFLFGERGVWRPGDSLYLTFILEDKQSRLPAGHPITFELKDPQGHTVRSLTRSSGGSFYSFATATDVDAPTGNYLARVKAGPAIFEEAIKIATVVPNRLKIRAEFSPKPLTTKTPIRGNLNVSWLSGATAKNLETDVELTLQAVKPEFPTFTDFEFNDPARKFDPESQTLFHGELDGAGKVEFSKEIHVSSQAPGALKANFRTRVTEAGGGFSVDRFTETLFPYNAYVGVKLPSGDKARGMLLTDTLHSIRICVLDAKGQRISKRRVKIELYKTEWHWWWEKSEDESAYLSDESRSALQQDTVTIMNGEGQWGLKVKYPDWGRYLLRVCDIDGDKQNNHCTGKAFYMDWPGWAGRAQREGAGGGAAILAFSSDKPKYNVGENIHLTIPSPKGGRALISIEKGGSIYKRYWIDLNENKETVHSIEVKADMAPNVYVYVALLQPHEQTQNDLPIRMYNVIPILIEDPATRLKPELNVSSAVFKPGEKATLSISESNGKAMQYVIAVVDEGLLDLTRFKTPEPWERFYAREALGIKTWDLFDFVAGAYGDRLERLLSIGGDEGGLAGKEGRKGNRFPPMVVFKGPFQLEKGKRDKIEIAIPQYVGSVRVMVVAGGDGAYGMAEKAVPVRKPLMVLGTLPRLLAPGETFELPISVFAMEKQVKKVDVEISVSGPIKVMGTAKQNLNFSEPADELVTFTLETSEAVGWAKVHIKARSGQEVAEQNLEIEVRNPNTRVTEVLSSSLQPGAAWPQSFNLPGVIGTNKATLELSRIPPLDLGKRLSYLIQYPHGCVEQTTSSVFPQLYLDALMDLPETYKANLEKNVKAGIHRLRAFQTASGGLSYWPGESVTNNWGTSYAGHFLIEAAKKGYSLPDGMMEQWVKYQRAQAQAWTANNQSQDQLEQAYRLYTLALQGAPEIGAMNRLKEMKKLSLVARWQLGGAYQLAGQPEIAKTMVQGDINAMKPYSEQDGTFGSDLRDKAMMLEVLSAMGLKNEAAPLMKAVAEGLSQPEWWSTQTTAYSLLAVERYTGRLSDQGGEMKFSYQLNGENLSSQFSTPIWQKVIKSTEGKTNSLELKNQSNQVLYARLILDGIPALGQETEANNGLQMRVQYTDMQGENIDVTAMEQGKDLIAEYHIKGIGTVRKPLKQLALTSLFPSGWEIRNAQLDPTAGESKAMFEYQEYRDDRVLTYFSLAVGEEKVFKIYLNAAYLGRFHLPQSKVEAMYDAAYYARNKGIAVEVVPAGN